MSPFANQPGQIFGLFHFFIRADSLPGLSSRKEVRPAYIKDYYVESVHLHLIFLYCVLLTIRYRRTLIGKKQRRSDGEAAGDGVVRFGEATRSR